MQAIIQFFTLLVSILILDFIWIGLIAKNIYEENIGMMLRKSGNAIAPVWPAAFFVYFCIALGILFFVLPKANGSYLRALIWGGIFGMVTYGIYDFTNYAILSAWPYKITILDFVWGICLCAIASVVAVFVTNRII